MTLFIEIAIALVLAAALGIFFYLLKQPTIIGFILAGLAISYFGYLSEPARFEIIEVLSAIGVALLLFIVGLEMSFRELKDVSRPSIILGVAQAALTFAAGYLISVYLGFSEVASAYIGIAITFSSTIILVKLLSEKNELKSLYGRIALGSSLVQDLMAVVILIFLAGLTEGGRIGSESIYVILKGFFFGAAAIISSRFLPKLLNFIGTSPELLYLFGLSWAVGWAAFISSPLVGLSIEIGGFLAGLSLASSSEHFQIGARLKPLRDFFLIIFFIGLGAKMLLGAGGAVIVPALILSVFVLIGNPIIVMLIMGFMGYKARTSFLTSVTFAQVSEFSFVIMFLGYRLGHFGASEASLVTLIGIITIFISSYMIIYGDAIYRALKSFLKLFEFRRNLVEEVGEETLLEDHIVLVGVHRMGQNILKALHGSGEPFVAVDFDPRVINKLRENNLPCFYGDITDFEIQKLVGLDKAKLIISTVPDMKDNQSILSFVRTFNPEAKTILTGDSEHEAEILYEEGADYVLLPHFVGGVELIKMINEDKKMSGLHRLKERDLELIKSI